MKSWYNISMNLMIFAVLLSAVLSHAGLSPEAASSSAGGAFLSIPASAFKFQPAGLPILSAFAQNRVGTIKGGMNHSPVDITIDKRAWTIKGGMNHSPVDIAIDHEKARITGGANHSPVSLAFAWTPESVLVEGGANRSPVKLYVNWKDGILRATPTTARSRSSSMKAATPTRRPWSSRATPTTSRGLLPRSRQADGRDEPRPADVTVNADLYDFLQYFFLFPGRISALARQRVSAPGGATPR